jgi:hypothetical protein
MLVSKRWAVSVGFTLIIAALGAVGLLLFKSVPLPIVDFSGHPITLEIHREGRLLETMTLDRNSSLMNEAVFIIGSEGRKWSASIVNYAPRLVLRSSTFYVNFQDNHVILDHHGRQLVAYLTSDERETLASALQARKENAKGKMQRGRDSFLGAITR